MPGNAIEQAFRLADSGTFSSVKKIKEQLKREGYAEHELQGAALAMQLKARITKAISNSEGKK